MILFSKLYVKHRIPLYKIIMEVILNFLLMATDINTQVASIIE